jgi:hypothetical protein
VEAPALPSPEAASAGLSTAEQIFLKISAGREINLTKHT